MISGFVSGGQGRLGIVDGQELNDVIEVGHVLGDHEGGVAELVLLIVSDSIAAFVDRVTGPPGVGQVTQVISGANEHSDRDLASDVAEIDLGRDLRSVLLHVLSLAVVEDLEVLAGDLLRVVIDALDRGTSREVTHVDLEANRVIDIRVLSDEESSAERANYRQDSASDADSFVRETSENVVDAQDVEE